MKRIFERVEGYDCRNAECKHDVKGDHGIHNEEWFYTVSFGDYALSLTVSSGIYPSTVNTGRWHLDAGGRAEWLTPRGTYLGSHAAFFVKGQEDDFRKGKFQYPACKYVTGPGCNGDGSYLSAREFYKKHGTVTGGPEQPEAFWLALEALAVKWAQEARAQRLEDMHERCASCDGTGLVAKK